MEPFRKFIILKIIDETKCFFKMHSAVIQDALDVTVLHPWSAEAISKAVKIKMALTFAVLPFGLTIRVHGISFSNDVMILKNSLIHLLPILPIVF